MLVNHNQRAALIFSVVLFMACATYHWIAWPSMAIALWLGSGRDPLWIIEHSAKWLRAKLILWACIASWRVLHRFAGAKELVIEGREG